MFGLKFINKTTYNKKEIRIQFKIVLHQGNFTDYNLMKMAKNIESSIWIFKEKVPDNKFIFIPPLSSHFIPCL